jgi:hypothetical protein
MSIVIVALIVGLGLFTSLLIQAWEARTQEAQEAQVFKTWAAFLKADDQASKAWAAYEAAAKAAQEAREAHESARLAAAQVALRRALGLQSR